MITKTIAILALACGLPAGGQDSSLQNQLRKEYVGPALILRHNFAVDTMKFDAAGNPLTSYKPGSWTLGGVVIESLKLKSDKLELQGYRELLVLQDAGKEIRRIKWGHKLWIEIATGEGLQQVAQLHAALDKVFVNPGDDLVGSLPDYWQEYMARFFGRQIAVEPCQSSRLAAAQAGEVTSTLPVSAQTDALFQVSVGVMEGHLVRRAEPSYTAIARFAGVQGEVAMRAVISKSGDVVHVCLTHAVGGGLDDAAVAAVKQWQYQPYLLNGQPVEIETTIKIRYSF